MSTEKKPGAMESIVNVPGPTKYFSRKNHERKWYLVDAKGQSVGRLATQIADVLRGKHKPTFTRHDDVGDFVVVINASGLEFRGNAKLQKKKYYKHSGWYGHLKVRSAEELMQMSPETVLKSAVHNMINAGALCNRMMKKLKVYPGAEHPHKAQNPEPYPMKTR